MREALGRVDQGTYVEPSKILVADYLRRWLDGIRVEPTTLANYRRCDELYAIPTETPEGQPRPGIGRVPLQKLTAEHLDALYRYLEREGRRGGGPLKAKSVRHVHTMLRKALQDAVERGYLLRNVADLAHPPSQKQARSRKARDDVWTAEQLRAFLRDVEGDRMYAAWLLFATTGMRRGEVMGLEWTAVDLDAGRLKVAGTITTVDGKLHRKQYPKTAAGEREFALDRATVAALRAHRARQRRERLAAGPAWQESDLVFTRLDGRPVRPEWLLDTLKRRAQTLSLPQIDIHGLRHSYVTASLRAGVSPEVVQRRVGHAQVATTLGMYAHVRREDDEHAAETVAGAILGIGTHSGPNVSSGGRQ
jgi:integrase